MAYTSWGWVQDEPTEVEVTHGIECPECLVETEHLVTRAIQYGVVSINEEVKCPNCDHEFTYETEWDMDEKV